MAGLLMFFCIGGVVGSFPQKVPTNQVVRLQQGWSFVKTGDYVPDSQVEYTYPRSHQYEFLHTIRGSYVVEKELFVPDLRYAQVVDRGTGQIVVKREDQYSTIEMPKEKAAILTAMDSVFMTGPRRWISLPQSVWTWEGKNIDKGHLIEWVAK